MIVGVPREIKDGEHRTALTPEGTRALVLDGHRVLVQKGGGEASGFSDAEYRKAGAKIVSSASQAWGADLVLKVKEPLPAEFRFFRPDQILFTFLHLAPNRPLTQALLNRRVTAIGYETVEEANGHLPILRAMSEIAGRVAVLMGAYYQGNPQGGRGVLFGAMPGVAPAHVVILGGGTVGEAAAHLAVAMGSRVTILERRAERVRELTDYFKTSARVLMAEEATLVPVVCDADVLIGATHMPGARTPRLVSRALVKKMKQRSVIVDVAIDQGGSCETSRPTHHSKPTYLAEGILHYCVPNIPGAYARSSTLALAHSTLPYIRSIAKEGVPQVFEHQGPLAKGLQCFKGHLMTAAVALAQNRQVLSLPAILEAARTR